MTSAVVAIVVVSVLLLVIILVALARPRTVWAEEMDQGSADLGFQTVDPADPAARSCVGAILEGMAGQGEGAVSRLYRRTAPDHTAYIGEYRTAGKHPSMTPVVCVVSDRLSLPRLSVIGLPPGFLGGLLRKAIEKSPPAPLRPERFPGRPWDERFAVLSEGGSAGDDHAVEEIVAGLDGMAAAAVFTWPEAFLLTSVALQADRSRNRFDEEDLKAAVDRATAIFDRLRAPVPA